MGNINIDVEVERIAKIIYEELFDDAWDKVRIFNIEGAIYRKVARKVLEHLKDYIKGGV